MAAPTELKTTKLYHDQTTPDLFDRLAVSLDQFNISSFLKLEGNTEDLIKRNPSRRTMVEENEETPSFFSHLLALSRKLGQDGDLRFGGRIDRVKKLPYMMPTTLFYCSATSFTVRKR
jgi:hypothetical protein